MSLYNNIKIYEQAYIEFKNSDLQLKNFKFNNISIIQGTLDKTVNYEKEIEHCVILTKQSVFDIICKQFNAVQLREK